MLGLEILEKAVESYPVHMLYKMIELIREQQVEMVELREIACEYCPYEPHPYHDDSTAHGMHFYNIISQASLLHDTMNVLEKMDENDRNEMIEKTYHRLALKNHMVYRWLSEALQ